MKIPSSFVAGYGAARAKDPKERRASATLIYQVCRELIGDDLADQFRFPPSQRLPQVPLLRLKHRMRRGAMKWIPGFHRLTRAYDYMELLDISNVGDSEAVLPSAHRGPRRGVAALVDASGLVAVRRTLIERYVAPSAVALGQARHRWSTLVPHAADVVGDPVEVVCGHVLGLWVALGQCSSHNAAVVSPRSAW